jgi:hypothetical protein
MSDTDALLDEAQRNTETEIFDNAFTPEAETPKDEAPVTEVPKTDGRDPETGQFTAKETKETPEAADPKDQKQEEVGQIPSWRLKEEADARRAAESERDKFKSDLSAMQQRMAALEKPQQQKQEVIDPLLDPEGFRKSMQDSFNSELQKITLNNNLAIAHVRHGDTFEKAYSALLSEGERGNRQLVNQLVTSQNPGEAIVRWHKNQETLREVGNDPATYKSKVLEDALKDPAFLTKALEAARASAGQSQAPGAVQLPPSLSRVTGSSNNTDPADADGSEKAVFDYAFK